MFRGIFGYTTNMLRVSTSNFSVLFFWGEKMRSCPLIGPLPSSTWHLGGENGWCSWTSRNLDRSGWISPWKALQFTIARIATLTDHSGFLRPTRIIQVKSNVGMTGPMQAARSSASSRVNFCRSFEIASKSAKVYRICKGLSLKDMKLNLSLYMSLETGHLSRFPKNTNFSIGEHQHWVYHVGSVDNSMAPQVAEENSGPRGLV